MVQIDFVGYRRSPLRDQPLANNTLSVPKRGKITIRLSTFCATTNVDSRFDYINSSLLNYDRHLPILPSAFS